MKGQLIFSVVLFWRIAGSFYLYRECRGRNSEKQLFGRVSVMFLSVSFTCLFLWLFQLKPAAPILQLLNFPYESHLSGGPWVSSPEDQVGFDSLDSHLPQSTSIPASMKAVSLEVNPQCFKTWWV